MKMFKLLDKDGTIFESSTPGELGGNSKASMYGRLDCTAANAAIKKGYAAHRVFFTDQSTAIDAGYRPCGRCLHGEYAKWKEGGVVGTKEYPWKSTP